MARKKPERIGTGRKRPASKRHRWIEVRVQPDGPTLALGPNTRPLAAAKSAAGPSRSDLAEFVTRAAEYLNLHQEPEFQRWILDVAKKDA